MTLKPLTRPPLLRLVEPEPVDLHPPLPMPSLEVRPPLSEQIDPALERMVAGFCRALSEVLNGRRPLAQLRPMLAPQPASVVSDLLRRTAGNPFRPTRVRLQIPCAGAIEATVRLTSPGASCALAARLENRRGRWYAVALEAALLDDCLPRR